MKLIALNMVRANPNYVNPAYAAQSGETDFHSDTDEVGGADAPAVAPAVVASSEPEEISVPVSINVDAIRCFYRRKDANKSGTRITFTDGGGFAVAESYDEVLGMVRPN